VFFAIFSQDSRVGAALTSVESPVVERGTSAAVRSDPDLLSDYRASRSPQAFSEVVARHGPAVFRTCLRIAGNRHDAEDAAQAVFLILARRPEAVSRTLSGWLHGTACRTAWRLVRNRARRKEILRTMAAPESPKETDLRRELDQALERIPEHYREAVVLRYLEGRSEKEAASLAGCPQGTLGWRAMEGLNRLRALLARSGAPLATGVLLALMAKEAAAAAVPATLTAAGAAIVSSQVMTLVQGGLKAMMIAKLKVAAVMVLAIATPVIGAGTAAYQVLKVEVGEDDDLPPPITAEKFAACFETVKPYPGEWRWREEIPWVGTIHEARARAAKENKPILAWKSADSPPLGST
jgi:RNA polymerase sigma factor (sigma-70 family)